MKLPLKYLCLAKTSSPTPALTHPAVWPSTLDSTPYVSYSRLRTSRHLMSCTGSSLEQVMWAECPFDYQRCFFKKCRQIYAGSVLRRLDIINLYWIDTWWGDGGGHNAASYWTYSMFNKTTSLVAFVQAGDRLGSEQRNIWIQSTKYFKSKICNQLRYLNMFEEWVKRWGGRRVFFTCRNALKW